MHLCVSCGLHKFQTKSYIYIYIIYAPNGTQKKKQLCFQLFFNFSTLFFFFVFPLFLNNGPSGPLSPFPPTLGLGEEAHLEVQLKKCQTFRTLKRLTKTAQLEGCRANRWFFGVWIGLCLDMASKLVLIENWKKTNEGEISSFFSF